MQLIINSLQSGEVHQAILEGKADIGINCDKDYYPDTIVHKYIGTYRTLLVASPFSDPSLLDFITPHQRKPLSLICNEPDGYYQLEMNHYLTMKDIILNPYMKVQSIEAVKKCVMNNLGIAIVPSYSVTEEMKNGSLIPIKTEIDETKYNSVCIYNKNKWLSPQMQLALDIIESSHIDW